MLALYHLRSWCLLLAIVVALSYYFCMAAPRPAIARRLGTLLLVALGVEGIGYWTTLEGVNNNLLYNAFVAVDMVLVLSFFALHTPAWATTMRVLMAIGLCTLLATGYAHGSFKGLWIEGIVLNAIMLAVVASAALWRLANQSTVRLTKVPEFWMFMGIVVYFGGLVPIVLAAKWLYIQDPTVVTLLWTVLPVLGIVRYGLAAYACNLWYKQQEADR